MCLQLVLWKFEPILKYPPDQWLLFVDGTLLCTSNWFTVEIPSRSVTRYWPPLMGLHSAWQYVRPALVGYGSSYSQWRGSHPAGPTYIPRLTRDPQRTFFHLMYGCDHRDNLLEDRFPVERSFFHWSMVVIIVANWTRVDWSCGTSYAWNNSTSSNFCSPVECMLYMEVEY